MNTQKLNPWNWFKHEESVPVRKGDIAVKSDAFPQTAFPISNIGKIHHEIDRIFDDVFHGVGFPSMYQSPMWNSSVNDAFMDSFKADLNIASDDKQYTITLEAPGLEEKDLSINIEDRALVIKGDKLQKKEDKDKRYYRIERHFGKFERVLALPDDADVDAVHASMDNGLLSIVIPRKESAPSEVKQINIDQGK